MRNDVRLVRSATAFLALLLAAGCGARVSLGDIDDLSSDASAVWQPDGASEASGLDVDEDAETWLDAASFDEPPDDAFIEDADFDSGLPFADAATD